MNDLQVYTEYSRGGYRGYAKRRYETVGWVVIRSRGSMTANLVPLPTVLVTSMRPW